MHIDNGDFLLVVNGKKIERSSGGVRVIRQSETVMQKGMKQVDIELEYEAAELRIGIGVHCIFYEGSSLFERWVDVCNIGTKPFRIGRIDSFQLDVQENNCELMYYTSGWGAEFESVREPLIAPFLLETRTGRSSGDKHPWFTLFRPDGQLLTVSAQWSGNWVFRFEALGKGGHRISGGLNDWESFVDLKPGDKFSGIRIAAAYGHNGDLNTTSVEFARIGRAYWYARNDFSQRLPVEWNHWWSYEDKQIDEHVFRKNADAAATLGVELCTLDAGWFGPTEPDTDWFDYRGDWNRVNAIRFPSGIRSLSDHVHTAGMKFGLWCEIEALGRFALLGKEHPHFPATRDGESLGYVCFGCEEVQQWAFAVLDRMITEYRCEWIKLDFNLNPQAGCDRTDHGHGAGDGLHQHYAGYYATLDRIRAKHSEVILENCSSGGLRIDIGMLRHTHTTFLSDPDWPVHNLQVFWGASTMLAPDVCLHWSYSDWLGEQPTQQFDPNDPALKQHQLDYYIRTALLGGFGLSQKLPELPAWVAERYRHHIDIYRRLVRRFVRSADVYRLTDQPRRNGQGDRWTAFQYTLSDGDEHLLFVFRLDGAEPKRTIRLIGLEEQTIYTIRWLSEIDGNGKADGSGRNEGKEGTRGSAPERLQKKTGGELMRDGLLFDRLFEEDSALMLIRS